MLENCADDFLNSLLDQFERNPDGVQRAIGVDRSMIEGVDATIRFEAVLRDLASKGIISLIFGKKGLRDSIEKVRLANPLGLYRELDRIPHSMRVNDRMETLRSKAQAWETEVLSHIEGLWLRKRKWQSIAVEHWQTVRSIQALARAIKSGEHARVDWRTLCARVVSDSKFAERNEASIIAYLYHGKATAPTSLKEAMTEAGSKKIALPIIMSGPFSVDAVALGEMLDYCGIAERDLSRVALGHTVEYVLTIENLTSFHRHAVEVNRHQRRGLVLYTGGQPSRALQDFYTSLVERLSPAVPFFHWSDIDQGGLDISRTMIALNGNVRPHLMSVDLLETHGSPCEAPFKPDHTYRATWLEPLADRMAAADSLWLEQEKLDPKIPDGLA